MKVRVLILCAAVALVGLQVGAVRATDLGRAPTDLQRVVDRLGVEADAFDRGAILGISVIRLDTGERASFQGDRWLKSASSLKPTWVVAAIEESGIEAVAPFSDAIWLQSSNRAAGEVIGLAGGLDPINRFTRGIGMSGTLVVEWTTGGDYRAADYPGPHPALNFTTPDDLVTFWRLLHEGWLLPADETAEVLEWASVPRQPGYLSGMLTRLPESVWPGVAYKMGWLPPGRTEVNEETGEAETVDALDTLIGSGVVEVPDGPTYVVAVGSFGGTSWPGKVSFVAYAHCRIHEVIVEEDLGCDRPGDPARTRLDRDPPIGVLASVSGSNEFITVRGWAADPDDYRGNTIVRFTIDGFRAGSDRADEPTSWGSDSIEIGRGHGFSDLLLAHLAAGSHEICAFARNDGSGPGADLGCLELVVR